jgi:hypothetical protein
LIFGPNLDEETVKDKVVVVGQGVSPEGKDTAEHPNIDMYETGEEIVWWMLKKKTIGYLGRSWSVCIAGRRGALPATAPKSRPRENGRDM